MYGRTPVSVLNSTRHPEVTVDGSVTLETGGPPTIQVRGDIDLEPPSIRSRKLPRSCLDTDQCFPLFLFRLLPQISHSHLHPLSLESEDEFPGSNDPEETGKIYLIVTGPRRVGDGLGDPVVGQEGWDETQCPPTDSPDVAGSGEWETEGQPKPVCFSGCPLVFRPPLSLTP